MKKVNLKEYAVLSQSPYTWFNRRIARKLLRVRARINPPIRGSIVFQLLHKIQLGMGINPPIRGSIGKQRRKMVREEVRINPPIRGSIE